LASERSSRRPGRGARATVALGVGLLALLAGLAAVPWPRDTLGRREGPALAEARSWGYQLQNFNPLTIPSMIDVMVVDYSRDGTARREMQPEEVAALRRRLDGGQRIVLAYLSIGEAESYRFYWRGHWAWLRPGWLGPESTTWKGNYPVRFWQPGWQRLIVQGRPSALGRLLELQADWRKPYVDRVIEAGFDGVYLDRVDAYYEWKGERSTAEEDMVELVTRLSAYARARKPGFLVVAQNGEELLAHEPYLQALDGVAKEDLMFGVAGDERRNRPQEFLRSAGLLGRARAAGLKVMVVEYVEDPAKRAEARARMGDLGFLIQFAQRRLNLPPE
jgi:cysteinyl-tRNA synthetase